VIDVHVVCAQPPQAGFERAPQMVPRGALVVGAGARRESGLCRDERLIALARERTTQDLLRAAVGVAVGGIEQVYPSFEADVNETPRLFDLGFAEALEKLIGPAKGRGAETQCGNFEAGASQQSIFHGFFDALLDAELQMLRAALPPAADSRPLLPVRRIAASVKTGDDGQRLVGLDHEHERVGKAVEQGATDAFVDDRKLPGIGAHALNHGINNYWCPVSASSLTSRMSCRRPSPRMLRQR